MLTAEQQHQRRNAIGSSDVAAILGVSHWKTAYDLWLEKTGRLPDQPERPWMRVGSRMESAVLDEFEENYGTVDRDVVVAWPEINLACRVDAILVATGEPVEAKTAGLFGPLGDEWGDEGSEQVPREYVVQAHAHLVVTKSKVCHVPTLLGRIGFRYFKVDRSERLCGLIIERVAKFWRDHVVADVPPKGVDGTPEIVKQAIRTPGKVANVPTVLVAELVAAGEAKRQAENRYEQIQTTIRMFDPGAEAFDYGDGAKWITDYEQGRTSIDGSLLKANHPDIYEQVVKESRYRVMRVAKRPKANGGKSS